MLASQGIKGRLKVGYPLVLLPQRQPSLHRAH